MSPKGECWKISVAANSITGAQPESAGSGTRGLGPTAGHKSRGPETQASLGMKFVFGPTTDECADSGAGSIHPSSDDARDVIPEAAPDLNPGEVALPMDGGLDPAPQAAHSSAVEPNTGIISV